MCSLVNELIKNTISWKAVMKYVVVEFLCLFYSNSVVTVQLHSFAINVYVLLHSMTVVVYMSAK